MLLTLTFDTSDVLMTNSEYHFLTYYKTQYTTIPDISPFVFYTNITYILISF